MTKGSGTGGYAVKDLRQMSLLLDFYGPLLTERQQELMQAYFLEDLSLAEIADQAGVSRQAVHDLIKRSEGLLLKCEEKLHCVRDYEERQVKLTSLEEALARGETAVALSLLAELKAE